MRDTGWRDAPRLAATCALIAMAGAGMSSCAASNAPRLLWAHSDHVYVALEPGDAASEGDSVRFEERGRPIASGRVAEVVRGEVALVSVPPESFDRVKRLDRVRVSFARAKRPRPPSMRVALPAGGRGNLLVSCAGPPGLPVLPGDLRGYVLSDEEKRMRPLRLRPDPHSVPPEGWPDTLIVSYFESATDEEIALERGDVDVAVFWPGELSRRVREDARWKDPPLGPRSRGIVAITGADFAPAGLDSATAVAFNDELFRGDLEWTRVHLPPPQGGPGRVEVDPALPGAGTIREWLARRAGRGGSAGVAGRLAYVDGPRDAAPRPSMQPLFLLRCPVACAPEWRPVIRRIGAGVFADMVPCASPR